jgi:hypothetical protein
MAGEIEWLIPVEAVATGTEDVLEAGSTWQAPSWLEGATEWVPRVPHLGRVAIAPIGLVAALTFGPSAAAIQDAYQSPMQAPAIRACQITSVRVALGAHQPGLLVEYVRPAQTPASGRCGSRMTHPSG